jgi:hypothetical protein
MQRRHSFTLPTLFALAFPAVLASCVAEPATEEPGAGGAGAVGGATAGTAGVTSAGGMAGTATAGAGAGGTGTAGTGTAGTGTAGTGTAGTGTAGTGTAGTGTAGTGTAGTGTAGTGTAGTGTAGAGGATAGAGGTAGDGGTAGTGTAGTGTAGAGGYNTDAACMGIRSNMPCTPADQMCPNLRCGLHDLGRRACVCSTNWSCESCAFPADAPPIINAPATPLEACSDTAAVLKGAVCTTEGTSCQPSDEPGDVCACWTTTEGALEWDCDSKPWE